MKHHRMEMVPDGTSRSLRRAWRVGADHARRKASGACHPDFRTRYPRNRRGGALVFVLILLLFLSMLGITLARLVIAQHRQRLQDELQAQAVRLADAGWNRALGRLVRNPKYAGEVWQLDAKTLIPDRAAAVRIEVVPAEADPAQRLLHVTAEYPVGSPDVHRVSREGVVPKL